ncbi:hypothetical protein D8M04_02585 [Oceanobacillus piezotolerans]|uniref:Uncharacterized protein n=1 Tax=Oceanobacillus piezotolerans TaxID=2448030 RepID=A0A498DMA6_9BACI|nr:hypothetical protein [Oceanobacillus piezotolerans]RLL48180.1 hypothetical protein D8M04_02585 [Oceanobacillus piezotolerans]
MNEKADKNMDQADELRDLIEEIEEIGNGNEQEDESSVKMEEEPSREIDILNLPPRKEVHTNKAKAHLKLRTPFIRFLLVIVLLAAVIISAYYYWGEGMFSLLM